MADQRKCAHAACECQVTPGGKFGNYCSEHCKENADLVELKCDCGHPGCGGH